MKKKSTRLTGRIPTAKRKPKSLFIIGGASSLQWSGATKIEDRPYIVTHIIARIQYNTIQYNTIQYNTIQVAHNYFVLLLLTRNKEVRGRSLS